MTSKRHIPESPVNNERSDALRMVIAQDSVYTELRETFKRERVEG